ncbi:MAG: hypothetical protein MR266_05240 [Erysipelotrichaceae bacterium]|nr:hypothetical protein [Erysipelotrichaceae bacterium]
MKKKNIIALMILLLGISLVIISIKMNKKNESNNLDYSDKVNFNIENFSVKQVNDTFNVYFIIKNLDDKDYSRKKLIINFYQEDELIYKTDYELTGLKSYDSMEIDSKLDFNGENITKYEFVIDTVKKEFNPQN